MVYLTNENLRMNKIFREKCCSKKRTMDELLGSFRERKNYERNSQNDRIFQKIFFLLNKRGFRKTFVNTIVSLNKRFYL